MHLTGSLCVTGLTKFWMTTVTVLLLATLCDTRQNSRLLLTPEIAVLRFTDMLLLWTLPHGQALE